jgi:release factor glutamine methyltransferase
MDLYLNFDRSLTPGETDELRELIRRRGEREPLQHILGSTSFWGLEIAVNKSALIPRPETELLAENAWTYLSTLNPQPSTAATAALDFGTGTGCLAITLAVKCPAAQISALDISPGALALARQNAVAHAVDSRIQFLAGDSFAAVPPGARFDLVISNPPYIPSAEIATLQPEVRDHDPRLALDGGADGLDFYRRFACECADFLKPGGRLMLEFGDGQAPELQKLFEQEKWIVEAVKPDYSGRPRIMVVHRTR